MGLDAGFLDAGIVNKRALLTSSAVWLFVQEPVAVQSAEKMLKTGYYWTCQTDVRHKLQWYETLLQKRDPALHDVFIYNTFQCDTSHIANYQVTLAPRLLNLGLSLPSD
jgi:hypothetical protein